MVAKPGSVSCLMPKPKHSVHYPIQLPSRTGTREREGGTPRGPDFRWMDGNLGVRTGKISTMKKLPNFERQAGFDRAAEAEEREAARGAEFGLRLAFGSSVHCGLSLEALLHRQGEARATHRHSSVGGSPGLVPQPADWPLAPGLPVGRVSRRGPRHGELWDGAGPPGQRLCSRGVRKEPWAPSHVTEAWKMNEVGLQRVRKRAGQPFPLQGPSPGTRHFNGEEAGPAARVPPCPPRPRAPPPRCLLPQQINFSRKETRLLQ